MRNVVCIILVISLTGCLKQAFITERDMKKYINKSLPRGWRITSIDTREYPWGFEKDGPAGYHVVISAQKRRSRIIWEESRNNWRSAYQYVKPSYNIWIMPEMFHGDSLECTLQTSYYCDTELSSYIGSNEKVSIFINCERCYYIKSNFKFRKKELIKNLRKAFNLNRNIYNN